MTNMTKYLEEMGKRIKERRIELNISQVDLAKKLGYQNRSSVIKLEKGQIDPSQSKIIAIAKALSTTPDYIVGWDTAMSESEKVYDKYLNQMQPVRVGYSRWLPYLGEVACGEPVTAVQEEDEFIEVDKSIKGDFVLKAKGNSMKNARINDGDLIVFKKQETAENGDIVVVILDGEATLKRFFWNEEESFAILHPENEEYEDIQIHEGDYENAIILGKATKAIIDIK